MMSSLDRRLAALEKATGSRDPWRWASDDLGQSLDLSGRGEPGRVYSRQEFEDLTASWPQEQLFVREYGGVDISAV
jgi:hypothetical protein